MIAHQCWNCSSGKECWGYLSGIQNKQENPVRQIKQRFSSWWSFPVRARLGKWAAHALVQGVNIGIHSLGHNLSTHIHWGCYYFLCLKSSLPLLMAQSSSLTILLKSFSPLKILSPLHSPGFTRTFHGHTLQEDLSNPSEPFCGNLDLWSVKIRDILPWRAEMEN